MSLKEWKELEVVILVPRRRQGKIGKLEQGLLDELSRYLSIQLFGGGRVCPHGTILNSRMRLCMR